MPAGHVDAEDGELFPVLLHPLILRNTDGQGSPLRVVKGEIGRRLFLRLQSIGFVLRQGDHHQCQSVTTGADEIHDLFMRHT